MRGNIRASFAVAALISAAPAAADQERLRDAGADGALADLRAHFEDELAEAPAAAPIDGDAITLASSYRAQPATADAKRSWPRHDGLYARFSGLIIDQDDDLTDRDTGETFAFDAGGGFTLGVGYLVPTAPVSFEVEYAYRRVTFDDPDGDGRFGLHTLSANVLLDAPDLLGPVGFYAGGGVGFRIDEFRFSSSGGSSQTSISGEGFFWQAMGGVTVSVNEQLQLYSGARWTDGGVIESEQFRFDSAALNIEFGLRIFF